jgi:hypothetical protein
MVHASIASDRPGRASLPVRRERKATAESAKSNATMGITRDNTNVKAAATSARPTALTATDPLAELRKRFADAADGLADAVLVLNQREAHESLAAGTESDAG